MLQGQPLHPIKHALQIFTDASKEGGGGGGGCSLRQAHCKRHLVPSRKQTSYKLVRTESSLLALKEFQDLCSDKIVLVATDNTTVMSYINKEGGMRPDLLAWAVDALSLPWEDLDSYAVQPVAILGKVVKLHDHPCHRIILITPGWSNRPWFWDLVAMSTQFLLSLPNLPNLLTQPFNQTPHRNLPNLNLHAWLLENQQLRNRASLRQWQRKLRPHKRGSTRSVYEAKWTIFTKWFLSNQVDFRLLQERL